MGGPARGRRATCIRLGLQGCSACRPAACLSAPPPVVVQVRKAKGEMRRLLEEETLRFGLQAAADKSAYGKFTVV